MPRARGKLAVLSLFGVNPARNALDPAAASRRARPRTVPRRERALHDRDGAARDAGAYRPKARSKSTARRSTWRAICCPSMHRLQRPTSFARISRCCAGWPISSTSCCRVKRAAPRSSSRTSRSRRRISPSATTRFATQCTASTRAQDDSVPILSGGGTWLHDPWIAGMRA